MCVYFASYVFLEEIILYSEMLSILGVKIIFLS